MSNTKPATSIDPEELAELLNATNFTRREITNFFSYADNNDGGSISKQAFAKLCLDQGIKSTALVKRMWDVFDTNRDGQISHSELVMGLNPLMRGTQDEIASLFFDIYGINGDGELTAAELIAVYSDIITYNEKDPRHGLAQEQKERLRLWVEEIQKGSQDGSTALNKETFIDAIRKMENEENSKHRLLSWRTVYLVFLVSWFEMGTSFSLPAMGALSDRIKERFDVGDTEIGTLTSAYFFAAMVGPLIGGVAMDKYGPGRVIIGANIVVVIGAALQAIADGKDQFALLIIGRLLLGLGGEITPFTTIEILGRLFPGYLGLMAGIRNLIQSTSTFLAFVLLPLWAESIGDEDSENKGTTFALWMCAVLGFISLSASVIVHLLASKENLAASEEQSDQATVSKMVRAFAKATTPRFVGWQKWKLPLSFYIAVFGIKAQYFAPFGFTAFSNEIYADKFTQSRAQSSFFSGFISLLAGALGPCMGPLSDKYGQRSLSLAFVCSLAMVGFAVLALTDGGDAPVWIASILFAVQYAYGDTVAYLSIRFIVGTSRAGIGYGVYGIFGNLIATIVPIVGGALMDQSNGNDKVLWYFAGLMALGAFCWLSCYLLEGPRSLLELPADNVIETSDKDIQAAALTYVAAPPPRKDENKEELDVPDASPEGVANDDTP